MNTRYIIIIVAILAIYGTFSFGKKFAVAPEVPNEQKEIPTVPKSPVETATEVAPISLETEDPAPQQELTSAPVAKPTPKKTAIAPVKPKTVSKTTVSTPPAILKDGSYLVTYSQTGFFPQRIDIKRGQSVHFLNSSDKAMNIVATEQGSLIYGELNQGKSVGRGGTYDFTFLKTGAWTYMNRNVPADSGVIIVTE